MRTQEFKHRSNAEVAYDYLIKSGLVIGSSVQVFCYPSTEPDLAAIADPNRRYSVTGVDRERGLRLAGVEAFVPFECTRLASSVTANR